MVVGFSRLMYVEEGRYIGKVGYTLYTLFTLHTSSTCQSKIHDPEKVNPRPHLSFILFGHHSCHLCNMRQVMDHPGG